MTAWSRPVGLAVTALMLLASCAVPPKDPYAAGEWALQREDLLRALRAFDAVPVSHERYPDARAAAVQVELRMRRCHELILEALMLRGQWRDGEALEALRRAHEHWPTEPNLPAWIAATERRMRLFADRRGPNDHLADEQVAGESTDGGPTAGAPMGEVRPLVDPDPSDQAPAGEPPATLPAPDLSAVTAPAPADEGAPEAPVAEPGERNTDGASQAPARPAPERANAPGAQAPQANGSSANEQPRAESRTTNPVQVAAVGVDPVAPALVAVEARLAAGERECAVRDLLELAQRFPGEARVARRLVRLLHQRALLRYGEGLLAAAISDWRRVLEIEPDHEAAGLLLRRAIDERARIEARSGRGSGDGD